MIVARSFYLLQLVFQLSIAFLIDLLNLKDMSLQLRMSLLCLNLQHHKFTLYAHHILKIYSYRHLLFYLGLQLHSYQFCSRLGFLLAVEVPRIGF